MLQFQFGKVWSSCAWSKLQERFSSFLTYEGCFAPHPVSEHQDGKKNWRFERISKLVADGARLEDCIVIEIFAGSGRVTACMKQLGAICAFGVDHVRSKQCMSQFVVADLCTHQGVSLLWQWLAQENVVAIFLPPCGSASRARQIPLKRTLGKNSHGPLPLRDDLFPNGKPGLSFRDRQRFHLRTSCITLPASWLSGPIWLGALCVRVKNLQFSLFWATTFWTAVAKQMQYSIFHSCQYGGIRKKKTMLAFNHEAFHAVSAKCKGQNSKHKHAAWGLDKEKKKFATSEEAAYPRGLPKLLANCIAMALITLGIKAPEETVHQLKSTSLKSLQQMEAATGVQPKASRIPPLVPTFKARIKLQAMTTVLPDFQLYQKCRDDIKLDAPSNPILPKGSKLLSIQPAKTSSDKGGGDPSCLPSPIVLGKTADEDEDHREQLVQTWGSPWSPMEFVKQKTFGCVFAYAVELVITEVSGGTFTWALQASYSKDQILDGQDGRAEVRKDSEGQHAWRRQAGACRQEHTVVERNVESNKLRRHGCDRRVYKLNCIGGFCPYNWFVACKIHTCNNVNQRTSWYWQTREIAWCEGNPNGSCYGGDGVGANYGWGTVWFLVWSNWVGSGATSCSLEQTLWYQTGYQDEMCRWFF